MCGDRDTAACMPEVTCIGFQLDLQTEEDSNYNRIKNLVNEELKQYFSCAASAQAIRHAGRACCKQPVALSCCVMRPRLWSLHPAKHLSENLHHYVCYAGR